VTIALNSEQSSALFYYVLIAKSKSETKRLKSWYFKGLETEAKMGSKSWKKGSRTESFKVR